MDLRAERTLLDRFSLEIEASGLVGERQNAEVIFLAAASAKLQRPLNVNVEGASAAGKNYLLAAVARLIPDEDKKTLTGMSPKVLMHSEEDEYQHKAVFIAEYEGVQGADYAIRTFQSEQVIEWEFVDSSKEGIRKQKRRVKGPSAFIQATTRVTLHPENETRLLNIQMDESEEQTRAIMERQAKDAALGAPSMPPGLFEPWHQLLRSLKQARVRIPFSAQLAEGFPATRVRSRRDFPKLLGLIEASAFLHQHWRNKDADGSIVATPQDYFTVGELFEHCYYAGPDGKVGELVQAASQLNLTVFSVADLMQKTGWRKSKTYDVLNRAEELGCIAPAADRGHYRLATKHVEHPLTLPTKLRLTAGDFRISTEGAIGNFHNSADGGTTSPCGKSEEQPITGLIVDGNAENAVGALPDVHMEQSGIEEDL